MSRRIRNAALIGTAVVAVVMLGPGMASAKPQPPTAPPPPCGVNDVSFYFGGASAGLSHRSFDITLLAHAGITCTLPDTPLVTLSPPWQQPTPIPLTVNGQGGTLVLRPTSPLHARVQFSAPDTTEDTLQVSSLTLAMPDGTSRGVNWPGQTDIYSGGVLVSSWVTGLGLGEGEGAF